MALATQTRPWALGLGSLVWLAASSLFYACAVKQSEPAMPAPSDGEPAQPGGSTQHRPLSELDALEHDLLVSEQQLEEHLAQAQATELDEAGGAPEAEPEGEASDGALPKPRQAPAPAPEAPATTEPRRKTTRADDVCALGCRALASMRRAAEGICELVPGSERCGSATERVERAAERVRGAGCVCDE